MAEMIPQFLSSLKKELSPIEYSYLEQSTNETPQRFIKLPTLRKLRIANLNLFNDDYEFDVKDGLNVIFGGNRNGKTTVANAIEFGIFGIFPHTLSYFASRALSPEKPVRIQTEIRLGAPFASIRREIFASSSSHKAKLNFFGHALADRGPSVEGPVEVQHALEEKIGCTITEASEVYDAFYLREVPRNYHLSSRIGEMPGSAVRRRILYRLVDFDRFNRIIAYCQAQSNELGRIIAMDKKELSQISTESASQRADRMSRLQSDLKEIDQKIAEQRELKKLIFGDMNILLAKSKPDTELIELGFELVNLASVLKAKNDVYSKLVAGTTNEVNQIVCEKCGQDFTEEAKKRISSHNCFTCGSPISEEQLGQISKDLKLVSEKEQVMRKKQETKLSEMDQITAQVQQLQTKLGGIDTDIEQLNRERMEVESELLRTNNSAGKERIDQLLNAIEESIERESAWNKVLAKTAEYAAKQTSVVIEELNRKFSAYTSGILQESARYTFSRSMELVDEFGE